MRQGLQFWAATIMLFIVALYPTIYLHELAHSVAAFFMECKENWWATDTSPILYKSFGGNIDYTCLKDKNTWATAFVDGAGICANLGIMIIMLSISRLTYRNKSTKLPSLFLSIFVATNFLEAASYLTINTFFLRSDMISVINTISVSHLIVAGVLSVATYFMIPYIFQPVVSGIRKYYPSQPVILAVSCISLAIIIIMAMGRMELTTGASATDKSAAFLYNSNLSGQP